MTRTLNRRLTGLRVTMWATVTIGLTGCLGLPRSYVDPGVPRVTYADVAPLAEGRAVHLTVEFQRFGKPHAQLSGQVLGKTVRVFLESGAFTRFSTADDDAGRLSIVVNNVGNVGSAVAQGIGTGLTFGLIGANVTDEYILTATYTPAGGEPFRKEGRHALHTVMGNRKIPAGQPVLSPEEAFDRVLEQLLLSLLRDLRDAEQRGGAGRGYSRTIPA